ncbi:hypothetical protein EV401DRAFT_2022900 [Pisolithus croceorrhizus]|nr:hypothetical protein EV401DRAFT_2022900 [Pisolithus croceorrhizus]
MNLGFVAISPFRTRAAKNISQDWLFNGYRHPAGQVPYWIVPFAADWLRHLRMGKMT